MRTRADQLTISHMNQSLILDTIRKHGKITRAGISQELRLSPPSVSSNIEKLIQKQLVLEFYVDSAEGPGRRGKLVGLNPDYSFIVCMDLSSPILTLGLGNINEEIIAFHQYDRIEGLNAPQILDCVKNAFSALLTQYQLTREQIGAIIVCSPGVINEYAGKIEYAPQFPGWEGSDVWRALHSEYGDKLILMNDVNVIALGEQQVGIGRYYNSFVYINVDVGIGGAIIIDNKLLEGHNLAAGEIGYMMTSPRQFENHASARCSLESQVSFTAIRERLAQKLNQPLQSLTIPAINAAYHAGDPIVRKELDQLIKMLAMCIVNISAVLNVPVICLGGMIRDLDIDITQQISRLIQDSVPYPPHICLSQLGATGFLHGALHLGTERILKQATKE